MLPVSAIKAIIAWGRRARPVDAWVVFYLRQPRHVAIMLGCIAVFALFGFLVLLAFKFPQDVWRDNAEAYAWGRQFLFGYGRHPPMTGWIAGLWYRVFPASDWASYLLSRIATFVSLASIYLVARRVLDARRAAIIVFSMMLYPVFVGVKSDRFNNYQMLLALSPLTIWLFLIVYNRRTIFCSIALGVLAAAAALTIYSAALLLFALALASILLPDRRLFFSSGAPYVVAAVFVLLVSPHLLWLVKWDFAPFHWLGSHVGGETALSQMLAYLRQNVAMISLPLLVAAIAMFPWRQKPPQIGSQIGNDGLAVILVAVVLVVVPLVGAMAIDLRLKPQWGEMQFFLIPIVILILMPRLLVTWLAVSRVALIVTLATGLHLIIAPIYAWENFKRRSDHYSYAPTSELAHEVTRLWRERFGTPLPIIVGAFEIAAPIVFYSVDHPRMFADSPDLPRVHASQQPAFSPWIDYPTDLRQNGFVGVCLAGDDDCLAELVRLRPDAESLEVTVTRVVFGVRGQSWNLRVRIAAPTAEGSSATAPSLSTAIRRL